MKKISLEQDTEEWLIFKRPRIGGSGAKSTAVPLTRKNSDGDYDPAGMWDLIANKLTTPADMSEKPMDRGHRLETYAIEELKTIVGKEFETKPGVWQSEEDGDLILSSDGCEPAEIVTYDAEVKSFTNAGKHFKLLYKYLNHNSRGFDLLQIDYSSDYRYQILHGFVVNPDLQIRYFVSYYPEALYPEHRLVVIPVCRDEVEDEIEELKQNEIATLKKVRSIVSSLVGDNF